MATTAQDAAEQEQWDAFRAAGFLEVVETEDGGVVVLLVGKRFSWASTRSQLPSLSRFVASQLETVAAAPYSLVYLHTRASYFENSPGVWWLWRTYSALPEQCRASLQRCYVVHADLALRLAAAAICPWLPGGFWSKVEYVPRTEFLPAEVQAALELPGFVAEHERDLAKQPLMDYGIAADAQETPLPQLATLRGG